VGPQCPGDFASLLFKIKDLSCWSRCVDSDLGQAGQPSGREHRGRDQTTQLVLKMGLGQSVNLSVPWFLVRRLELRVIVPPSGWL
jgi:hypothetical protein